MDSLRRRADDTEPLDHRPAQPTTYWFRIAAYNSTHWSAKSSSVSAKPVAAYASQRHPLSTCRCTGRRCCVVLGASIVAWHVRHRRLPDLLRAERWSVDSFRRRADDTEPLDHRPAQRDHLLVQNRRVQLHALVCKVVERLSEAGCGSRSRSNSEIDPGQPDPETHLVGSAKQRRNDQPLRRTGVLRRTLGHGNHARRIRPLVHGPKSRQRPGLLVPCFGRKRRRWRGEQLGARNSWCRPAGKRRHRFRHQQRQLV